MKCIHKLLMFICCLFLSGSLSPAAAQGFTHPGLLQSKEDLERIKRAVADKQEPIYSGYLVFQANAQSQYTYHLQGPMAMVGRNPTVGQNIYDTDAAAAYQNAIMWAITEKKEYAGKAEEIINAWSSTLKSITGRDAVLMAGLGPFKMINAAEILRYTDAGWSAADIEKAQKHFREVIYPVIKNYALFANGNWDSAAIKTDMAIGVFCNDRAIFEDALRYYVNGAGNGRLSNYIINNAGQCQESGRDQQHTQLGIAHLADCAEIAWHQGLNLYAYNDNLLLKGFEYTAKYNLGMEVPYTPVIDKTGKYLNKKLSAEGRGRFRTIYEQVYNHYVNRMGLPAPYTQQVAEKIRPEQQGSGGDNIGFGTLLYSRSSVVNTKNVITIPTPPAGLIAKATPNNGNFITWIESINAESYTIKRSESPRGSFKTLAVGIKKTVYDDRDVINGKTYYYTVSAVNNTGHSRDAYPVGITSMLPISWDLAALDTAKQGYAAFDGRIFTIQGEGISTDSVHDSGQFLYRLLTGNGTIIARYVPQISSQLTTFGLTIRQGLKDGDKQVSLLMSPETSRQVEAPHWNLKLMLRGNAGAKAMTAVSVPVDDEPIVTFSRLTGYCWIKLQRQNSEYSGYYSTDGITWKKIGMVSSPLAGQLYVGFYVTSGMPGLATTVHFDEISINNKPLGEK
ncbi:alginate lyase family protein [Mucilaginibacter sp. L196]|uniref:alginate lyase family protein n=1 Tax=Mucilaginibacter sp. L196 TaxID=1641870 RepID=UPI001C20815E|nr:alginate lyase family protein [Mucilaginibacter sp. L196]